MACELESGLIDEAAVLVARAGGHVLVLPGDTEGWESECPTSEPRMPFHARAEGADSLLEVSLERSSFPAASPFDESKHLQTLVAAIAERLQSEGYTVGASDEVALSNGHVGRLLRVDRPASASGGAALSVHGYVARALPSGEVLLAHFSWTSFEGEADTSLIEKLLQVFGVESEIFHPSPSDEFRPPSSTPRTPATSFMKNGTKATSSSFASFSYTAAN